MKRAERKRISRLKSMAYRAEKFPSKKPKWRGYDHTMFGPFRSSERMK